MRVFFELIQWLEPLNSLLLAGMALLMLAAFKVIFDRLTPFDDNQAMHAGVLPVAATRSAVYLGALCALSGSLTVNHGSLLVELGMFLLDGIVALIVFGVAFKAFDKAILWKRDNALAIRAGNWSVALAESGAYIALGLIVGASFAGGGQPLLQGIISAVGFSALGLATLVGLYLTYWCIFRRRYNIDTELGDGDVASGVSVGTLLLAVGVLLYFAISGDFVGWWQDPAAYAMSLLVGLPIVVAARAAAALMLARATEPLVRAILVGVVSIGASLLVGLSL